MFTKEELMLMKYKELVVLAKQYGVKKSRSKKVVLLGRLLSLIENEEKPLQEISSKDVSEAVNESDISDKEADVDKFSITEDFTVKETKSSIRRETFDMNPLGKKSSRSSRRETFDINPMEKRSPGSTRRETFDIHPSNASITDGSDAKDDNTDQDVKKTTNRRETFDIKPMVRITRSSSRRETFDVNPCIENSEKLEQDKNEEAACSKPEDDNKNSSLEKKAVLRQNTFSIDKPNKKSSLEKKAVLRQNTFSIDKPNVNLEIISEENPPSLVRGNTFCLEKSKKESLEVIPEEPPHIVREDTFCVEKSSQNDCKEMPGVLLTNVKSTPRVKPFSLNETPKAKATTSISFRTPMSTRNSVVLPTSLRSTRSIGQRIQMRKTAQSEIRPASRGSKLLKNLSTKEVSHTTPVRMHKPVMKGGKISKKITPMKLPNFKAIHMREFSKMESLIEHTNRKEERTKILLTPIKPNTKSKLSEMTSRIPVNSNLSKVIPKAVRSVPIKPVVPTPRRTKPSVASQNQNTQPINMNKNNPLLKDKLKFLDSPMTKSRRKTAKTGIEDVTNKIESNPKKRIINAMQMVSTKTRPFSVEMNRVQNRDILKTVRSNRRFELQMEVMRKAKV